MLIEDKFKIRNVPLLKIFPDELSMLPLLAFYLEDGRHLSGSST